jgi:ABC-type transport system involved in cytochrome c biogenesis permease subunit
MTIEYPVSLAILDYLPNLAFLFGAYFLVRIAAMAKSKKCSRMVMAGTLLITLGGLLKATWKLLYASGVGDFQAMSQVQFILLAPGFLAMAVAVILIARKRAKAAEIPVAAMAAWKMPFLLVMTVCSLGAQGILTYIAFKRGAKLAAVGFIFAFLGVLMMGGLASAEQTLTMQWIEESINSIGQLGFMTGSILLFMNYKTLGCEKA